jgi:hypothetical protein
MPIKFDVATRRKLGEALRRARPHPDVPAIIAALEGTAEVLDILGADRRDTESIRKALTRCSVLASRLRQALGAVNLVADDLVAGALVHLGYAPNILERLAEGLDMLADVLDAAQPPPRPARRPKGAGRVPGVAPGVTNWLAAEVARVLRAHDVRPTRHRDGGVYADVLRVIWPALLGIEAPTEIQHLLRAAPARPR